MKIVVSAPGKINILGEHAIVHGKPSILAAVNLRLTVSCEINTADSIEVSIESTDTTDYVRHILSIVQNHLRLEKLPPMKVRILSDIPSGYHLGSSAAVAVATAGAALYSLKKIWNPELINQLAYEAEKKQHGNPSGGDNTTVTFGGLIWFRKELEFLKSIWRFPFSPHESLSNFFLINTGRPQESTGEMVALVKSKIKNQKSKMEQLFNQNEEQVKRIAVALKEGNEKELLSAIRIGERTLEGMGVVSKKVIPLIRDIEAAGGAAKILGGGGRKGSVGFLLCYHHEPKRIEVLCNPFKYSIKHVQLGEEGVRLEEK